MEPFSIKWQVEEEAVEVQTVQSGRNFPNEPCNQLLNDLELMKF
jgi:hypothetical protein